MAILVCIGRIPSLNMLPSQCSAECLITRGGGGIEALSYSIFQFLWYKYSHCGQF